ncbi:MAG: NAD(+) diphosphatase, partial [Gemmatirosa sp.]|nr:NAD(+) diphosphatase [Gemmatirosa sp.]
MSAGSLGVPHVAYAGGRLDRVGALRKDDAWVAAALARDDAQLVPLCRDRHLVDADAEGTRAVRCTLEQLRALDVATEEWTLLGTDDGVPVLAAELTEPDADRVAAAMCGEWGDLRRIGPQLRADDAALLAYARGMVIWHRRHGHCGVCGTATERRNAGHMRQCPNPACGAETYPRTDPAVIMLVTRELPDGTGACLLAHHGRLPAGAFSTLAGFVEPGESLEEAVAREAREEAGVRIVRADYRGSQPWPFPSSLMIGFRARAASRELRI